MPAFAYQALDEKGKTRDGVLEADSAKQVRSLLRQQTLNPINVSEITSSQRNTDHDSRASKVRINHLPLVQMVLISRQLSVLLRSGAPLGDALSNIAKHSNKASTEQLLMAVRTRVIEGYSLAQGMAQFPRVFPDMYRATVEAGEQTGNLAIVLARLADYTEARQALRQRLTSALLYPAILVAVALLVLFGLLGYVVPQVVQIFEDIDQTLPTLTQLLLTFSAWVQDWGLWTILGLGICFLLGKQLMRHTGFKTRIHQVMLKLPFFGNLIRGINSARFARTLSILVASGVPIIKALDIASKVVANLPMREAVLSASRQIREGSRIHKALENTGYFPPMTVYLIASGELSGELESMLDQAAAQQERETDSIISTTLTLFEPLMILVMGGLVLIIVLAILLPIFELNQLVQ